MIWIYRIFGPPHELLHLLALWLIGRRATGFSWTHVDIPPDLTRRQYVFVAGLPALVFWGAAGISVISFFNSHSVGAAGIAFILFMVATFAGLGTMGDIQLIIARLMEPDDTS
jgi:Putative zincin peptidase